MLYWLFKEEPTHYSYDDLAKDKKTNWVGVRNNLALKYLRTVKKGDLIFYYHNGNERQIVGIMIALNDAHATDEKGSKTRKRSLSMVPQLRSSGAR